MVKPLGLILTIMIAILVRCSQQIGDYRAASSISRQGLARDVDTVRRLHGQEVKLWGYVDDSNLYGDAGAEQILGACRDRNSHHDKRIHRPIGLTLLRRGILTRIGQEKTIWSSVMHFLRVV